jgi:hypothetical protein
MALMDLAGAGYFVVFQVSWTTPIKWFDTVPKECDDGRLGHRHSYIVVIVSYNDYRSANGGAG